MLITGKHWLVRFNCRVFFSCITNFKLMVSDPNPLGGNKKFGITEVVLTPSEWRNNLYFLVWLFNKVFCISGYMYTLSASAISKQWNQVSTVFSESSSLNVGCGIMLSKASPLITSTSQWNFLFLFLYLEFRLQIHSQVNAHSLYINN